LNDFLKTAIEIISKINEENFNKIQNELKLIPCVFYYYTFKLHKTETKEDLLMHYRKEQKELVTLIGGIEKDKFLL
jgi:hypothetical protein